MIDKTSVLTEKSLIGWTLFAAAFGYVEALVVVYIRRLAGMTPGLDYPQIWMAYGLKFSSATIAGEMHRLGLWNTEITRESATIVLLAAAACAGGANLLSRIGLFGYTFAIWDITYYIWLRLWTGFPRSLASTDIYFLVPIAWYGPVWFPVLVFMPATIVASLWLIRKSKRV